MTSNVAVRPALSIFRCLRRAVFPTSRSNDASISSKPKTLRPTASLDSLRGIAALSVIILHPEEYGHQMEDYKIIEDSSGLNGQYHIATFPFIRILSTGGVFAVYVFFITSGCVVVHRPPQLVQQQDFGGLAESTGFSVFRRSPQDSKIAYPLQPVDLESAPGISSRNTPPVSWISLSLVLVISQIGCFLLM